MNFYLLYGTDTSIIGREIDIIKEKLSISDNDVIYYNIEDIQNVVDEALTISMFSANKLISIPFIHIFIKFTIVFKLIIPTIAIKDIIINYH